MIHFKNIIAYFILFSTIYSINEDINPDSLRYKVAMASRCKEPPIIDGVLEDLSWDFATPIDDFLQIEPVEFSQPSEKTIIKILFDDNALYISFNNFDSKPEKIRAPLTRRDAYMDGFNQGVKYCNSPRFSKPTKICI